MIQFQEDNELINCIDFNIVLLSQIRLIEGMSHCFEEM